MSLDGDESSAIRAPIVRSRPISGKPTRPVLYRDDEAVGRKPFGRLTEQRIAYLGWIKRAVDRSNQFNERVSAIQPVL